MSKIKEKWSDLDLKTRIAYVTAIAAFTLGWGLTTAGFIIGAGVVHDSVLWILGQALLYAASVLGVGMYITGSVRGMKRSISQFMMAEHKRLREAEEEIELEEEEDGRSEVDDTIH